MCEVNRREGQDGGGHGRGPGSPMAAEGSPERGAIGVTDRSARRGAVLMWERKGCMKLSGVGGEDAFAMAVQVGLVT